MRSNNKVEQPELKIVELEQPWLLEIWEKLATKAPCPDKTQPYCCYARTVIFYLRPYVIRPWHLLWDCNGKLLAQKPGQTYEEWDRCETALTFDSPVEFKNQRFICNGGSVIWKRGAWWMRHNARRERRDA